MATCRSTPSGLPIGRYTRPRILQSMHLSIYRGYPGNLYHPQFYLYRARFLTSIHIHPSFICAFTYSFYLSFIFGSIHPSFPYSYLSLHACSGRREALGNLVDGDARDCLLAPFHNCCPNDSNVVPLHGRQATGDLLELDKKAISRTEKKATHAVARNRF